MARLGTAWRAWIDLTTDKEHPRVLAAVRVLVGLLVLGTLLHAALDGVVSTLWIDRDHGGVVELGPGPWLIRLLGGLKPTVVWGVFTVACLSAVLVTIGAGGRAPYFIGAHTYFTLTRINGNTSAGYDVLFANALFLLLVAGASRTASVDCRIRTGKWTTDEPIFAWPRRLMIFQLVVMYATTGIQKGSPVWNPLGGYTALYYVLQDPNWRRFDLAWVGGYMPLVRVATAVTWHWELAAPLLLVWYWAKATSERDGRLRRIVTRFDWRKVFAYIGVGLHLGIFLAMDVGPFSLLTLTYYLAFLTPDEMRGLLDRIARQPTKPSSA